MKAWKRNLLIAYLACSIVALVFYFVLLSASTWPILAKALLVLLGVALACGVCVGAAAVVLAFIHEHATLHAGPEGVINIERSALESTAKRAMGGIEGVRLQHVAARVLPRQGEPVIDLTVTAVPFGTESLMVVAGRIQSTVKQAVEGFTDHEVRYVAVNFVEPRKRQEVKAAKQSVDARAANGPAVPRCTPAQAAPSPSGVAGGATDPFAGCGSVEQEARPSLWERAKSLVTDMRAKKNEDVVETAAVVEDVAAPLASEPAPDAPSAQPAPVVDLDDDFDPWAPRDAASDDGCIGCADEPAEAPAAKDDGAK